MVTKFFNLLKQDEILSPIIDEFHNFNSQLKAKPFIKSASYIPQLISIKDISDLNNVNKKDIPIRIYYPFFTSFSKQLHQIIHELWHFWQDRQGLFFSPPFVKDKAFPILDEKTWITLFLFCEAMAQTETIRSCYRLKKKNILLPWQGGLGLTIWKDLLILYENHIEKTKDEEQAALLCYQAWYKNHYTYSFYQAQAKKNYTYLKENFPHHQEYSLNLEEFLKKKPIFPIYLQDEIFSHSRNDRLWEENKYSNFMFFLFK